jgi:chromosome segregation ATPase
MSNVIKSLRSLVKARERRATRLEEELAQQRRLLDERRAAVSEAQAQHDESKASEQAARNERDVLMDSAFTPAALKALDFAIQDLVLQCAQAAQAVAKAQAAVVQQEQAIAALQAEISRNDQRRQSFRERIDKLLRERDQAAEEQADEEAEETAAARFSARQRQAREAAAHD